MLASLFVSSVALFALGAAITIFTGVAVWRSGGRQLLLGLAAAGLTLLVTSSALLSLDQNEDPPLAVERECVPSITAEG